MRRLPNSVRFAPSVIATQHDTYAAEAAIGTAQSRLFPRLNLEVTGDHGLGVTQRNDRQSEATAMVVVRWNLFNGGIDKARIGEAKARAMEAAEISANTQRIIEREVRTSWNAILAAEQRVPALSRQLELNRSTRNVYNQQFDAGQRRLLDLLDIQNETFVTEASLRTRGADRPLQHLPRTGRHGSSGGGARIGSAGRGSDTACGRLARRLAHRDAAGKSEITVFS